MNSSDAAPIALVTNRLRLRPASRHYASATLDYYLANREHLRPWEPSRCESFYTIRSVKSLLVFREKQAAAGVAVHLFMFDKIDGRLIGECNFTNVVRGAFQACHMGFSIDQVRQGQGLMRECLAAALQHVFGELKLHRVMANYRPENERSARLLERLGFEREGLARSYLRINGQWSDHVLTSLINPILV